MTNMITTKLHKRETLYKIDQMGRVRIWWMEYDDQKYRTLSGIQDGAIVESGWQYPTEKNIDKVNATTVAQQVILEVESRYNIQQYQGKYAPSIMEASSGAKFTECMLATKYDARKHYNFPYYSQPKLDGVRCLVSENGMQTRQGKQIVSSPHIRERLQSFFDEFPEYILDGELYNHSLKHDFEKIISLARKTKPKLCDIIETAKLIEYHIYDVITPEPMTYDERIKFLNEHITDLNMIHLVPVYMISNQDQIEAKLGEYIEAGYEGQMLREIHQVYEHKRSKFLIKHKVFEDAEFEIVDIIEGKGNWCGRAKSIMIRLPDGTTQQSGIRGNFDFTKELLKNKNQYIGTDVTVRYQNTTTDGKLRFPIAITFWKGKRDL